MQHECIDIWRRLAALYILHDSKFKRAVTRQPSVVCGHTAASCVPRAPGCMPIVGHGKRACGTCCVQHQQTTEQHGTGAPLRPGAGAASVACTQLRCAAVCTCVHARLHARAGAVGSEALTHHAMRARELLGRLGCRASLATLHARALHARMGAPMLATFGARASRRARHMHGAPHIWRRSGRAVTDGAPCGAPCATAAVPPRHSLSPSSTSLHHITRPTAPHTPSALVLTQQQQPLHVHTFACETAWGSTTAKPGMRAAPKWARRSRGDTRCEQHATSRASAARTPRPTALCFPLKWLPWYPV